MRKYLNFYLISIISVILFIAVMFFVINQLNQKPDNNLPAFKPESLPIPFSYLDPAGKPADAGYFTTSDDKSSAQVIARILDISEENDQVIGHIAANSNPQLKQKVVFFNSKYPQLLFTKQKTKEIFPLTADTTELRLKTKNEVLTTLKKIGTTPVVFVLLLNTAQNTKGSTDAAKYLECNSQFTERLASGINNISLDCPLFVMQMSVYEL